MARRGGRDGAALVVIAWRDIPAQINAGSGDDKQQRILPMRFHRSIDRAAMKAGKKTAGDYVQEWRRVPLAMPPDFDGDFAALALAAAEQMEAEYPMDRLKLLVANLGWNPDRAETATLEAATATGLGANPS